MPERAAHEPILSELASEDVALPDEIADSLPPPPPPCVPELGLTPASTAIGKETRVTLLVPPSALPDYELLEEIGRGAMGVIYRAWQPVLQRTVALKVILAGNLASAEQRARFRIEAQAIARLQHPNIVQIFDVGEHEGLAYLVLEYVEGGNLATRLDGQPLPQSEAAQIAETLAHAVHYAHERGIVHRDLKPANILLQPTSHRCTQINTDGTAGERDSSICVHLRSSVAKITDFGLAKRLDVAGGYTQTDAVLGTPPYMSPEQAAGKEIGPASDIYSLGVILYEMLTGRCPFRARTADETRRLVRECEPVWPRKYYRHVDRVLEAICLKCLDKEPARRYATAAALADDLGRWQRGEAVSVRPETIARRFARKVRRRPRTAVLVVLLLALTSALLATVYTRDPARVRERWERQLDHGESVTLIPDSGPPGFYRILTAETQAGVSPEPDRAFPVQCWKAGLVELLSDPRHDHFEISAQIRHDQQSVQQASPNPTSSAGVIFGYFSDPSGRKDLHSFCSVTFNDLMKGYTHFSGRRITQNPISLSVVGYDEAISSKTFVTIGSPERSDTPMTFEPFGEWQPIHYRQLAIEVSSRQIIVRFDGIQFTVPVAHIEKTVNEMDRPPVRPFVFNPRGGIGLYVERGKASFRSVTVTPLPDEQ